MILTFKHTGHELSCILNDLNEEGIEVKGTFDPSNTEETEDILYLATVVAKQYEITSVLDSFGQLDYMKYCFRFALEDIDTFSSIKD